MSSEPSDSSPYEGSDGVEERGSMTDSLEQLAPAEAVEWYLNHREPDLSEKSLQNQRYRLKSFVEFCDEVAEIENINHLTGRDLHLFRQWRLEEGDINKVTLRGQLQTLRVFLEFCASIDAVESGLRERVLLPEVNAEEESRDEYLDRKRAGGILQYLERFEYASRDHVIVGVIWHAGIRLGALRALDVDDFDSEARCLDLRHRPDTGTPLKNGQAAERSVAVGEHYCDVIADYIAHNREDVTDEYGRRPLISSTQGRLSQTPIRETVYKWSRPCVIDECPHDRDPDVCEAMNYGEASKCPSSRSPHGVRRGSITKHLNDGTPREVVSERMNVTTEVLEKHYDQRSEREKMEIRRDLLEGLK